MDESFPGLTTTGGEHTRPITNTNYLINRLCKTVSFRWSPRGGRTRRGHTIFMLTKLNALSRDGLLC